MDHGTKNTAGQEPRASRPQAPPSYPFARSTVALLPWTHVTERLESARNYWLATTYPDGRPHVTPIWGVWVEGALYFDGLGTTRWARNLSAQPSVAIHLESGEDVVIVEGTAEDVTTGAALGDQIVAAWTVKYGRLMPQPSTSGMFRLTPRTARAWSSSALLDGTRWDFDAGGGA